MVRRSIPADISARFNIEHTKNILASLENMDHAAKEQTKEIEKLVPAETDKVLWVLRKHRYMGW